MPMTKAEKAEMEALRTRCALAWPAAAPKPVDLDVARAAIETKWLHLWWFNLRSREVGCGVTDGHQHSRTNHADAALAVRFSGSSRIAMTQGPGGPWFASEADAYRALHAAVAQECAEALRNVERRTEAAIAAE